MTVSWRLILNTELHIMKRDAAWRFLGERRKRRNAMKKPVHVVISPLKAESSIIISMAIHSTRKDYSFALIIKVKRNRVGTFL